MARVARRLSGFGAWVADGTEVATTVCGATTVCTTGGSGVGVDAPSSPGWGPGAHAASATRRIINRTTCFSKLASVQNPNILRCHVGANSRTVSREWWHSPWDCADTPGVCANPLGHAWNASPLPRPFDAIALGIPLKCILFAHRETAGPVQVQTIRRLVPTQRERRDGK